jgi:hypothetical protein
MDGEKGTIREDGQTVVFETGDKIIELGNKEELAQTPLSEFGIEQESPLNIEVQPDNSVKIDGETYVNNFSNPQSAINTDADGNVVSINLETEGGQKRTIRGQRAQEIAYQYKLKEFEQNATEQSITRLEQEVTRLEEAAAKPNTEAKKRSVAPRKPKAVRPTATQTPKAAEVDQEIEQETAQEVELDQSVKPTIKMTFLPKAKILKSPRVAEAVASQQRIKQEYAEIKKLIDCLWKTK